ncbi:MAG: hypothetical protein JRE43_08755 [Deltaproteobacteria bacterium]|nr:hypothetical protein [Deltaproteobacteria bacterium]MBW2543594.1 hypothetical protein [Deltaproteobacteria bacterium]
MSHNRTAILDAGASALLVVLGSALAATALYFAIEREAYLANWRRVALFAVAPTLAAAAAFVAAHSERRRRFAVFALVTAATIYAGEIGLSIANAHKWSAVLAASDPRSKAEALEELRMAGRDAWPVAAPTTLVALASSGASGAKPLLALGGISNAESLYCGEGRAFVRYRSDRYGFFNPDGAYDEKPRLMLLGDSYIQGYCVAPDAGVAPQLRETFPGALNFGMNGNGPLIQLATLREFGPALEPEYVVWAFFDGNDFANLEHEREQPALMAYLESNHDLGLRDRQHEVNAFLRNHIAGEHKSAPRKSLAEAEGTRASIGRKFLPVLSLHNLLPFLGLPWGRVDFDYALFERVLSVAKHDVARWSGKLIFVYLPITSNFYGLSRYGMSPSPARRRVLEIVRHLDIPIVDLVPVIAALPDPMAVSSTPRTHYNRLGYGLVAREITRAVESQADRQ